MDSDIIFYPCLKLSYCMCILFLATLNQSGRTQRTIIIELTSKWRWRRKVVLIGGWRNTWEGAQQLIKTLSATLSSSALGFSSLFFGGSRRKEIQVLSIKSINNWFWVMIQNISFLGRKFLHLVTSGAADFLLHVAVSLCSYPTLGHPLHPPSLLIPHSLLSSGTDLRSCQRN